MAPQNDRRTAREERRVGVRQQIERRQAREHDVVERVRHREAWRRAIRLFVVPLVVVFACIGLVATGGAVLYSEVSHLNDRVHALEHHTRVPVLQPLRPVFQPLRLTR